MIRSDDIGEQDHNDSVVQNWKKTLIVLFNIAHIIFVGVEHERMYKDLKQERNCQSTHARQKMKLRRILRFLSKSV